MSDLVSIITPSYKSEKFIAKTIESALSQTHMAWEMLIVDDMSPDNSNKIINGFADSDERIKLIKLEKNSGPAIARNTAIEEARGRYIAFLDADDLWSQDKLQKQLAFMRKNDTAFTYSSYSLIDESDNTLGHFAAEPIISYNSMLKTSSVGCLTAIYDAGKLGKMFMPDILKRQDYGLWLNILKKIGSAQGIDESLATYRIRTTSVSSNKLNAAKYQWKFYREIEKLGLLQSSYYFAHYAYNGLNKYKQKS